MRIAILVDGGFYLKKYKSLNKHKQNFDFFNSKKAAEELCKMLRRHYRKEDYLYRIFYYDCYPFNKKIHHPITKKLIDFSKDKIAEFRLDFYNELKKRRKVALRLGYLKDGKKWEIYPRKIKELLNKKIRIDDLTEEDVYYSLQQKGIDIRIGIDIASLAYKKLVDQIVLISGDSDFVPAAKVARREGIDVVLDPMWNHIDDHLFEHIDGLKSVYPNPAFKLKKNTNKTK